MRLVKLPGNNVWVNPEDISTVAVQLDQHDSAHVYIIVTMHTGQAWTWTVRNHGISQEHPIGLDDFLRMIETRV